MKREHKISIGLLFAGITTVLTIVGSTAGSLAWYVYSVSTKVSFIGTSVAKSALLNVGIVDDSHWLSDEKVAQYELTRDTFDGHSIVFTHASDGLDYHVIQDYLFGGNTYASHQLFPLSTQARVLADQSDLVLYESPLSGNTSIDQLALTSHYVRLPLAFYLADTNGNPVPNIDVWLTDVGVQASGEHIDEALRVFVENSQRKFLMKPADKTTNNGQTKVGGILDLDGDGTYDYNIGDGLEFYYGQYNGTLTHDMSHRYGVPKDLAPYINANGVTNLVESTFYSKHNENAYLVDLTQITPKVAEYYSYGNIKPSVNSAGDYYEGATGVKMTTTNSASSIGYVTFTIFIEGWDHVVIDQAANYSFNLSMKFEVNRD